MIRLLVAAVGLVFFSGMILAGSVVVTVPLASDEQLQLYARVAEEMGLEAPWYHLVALDAVRYRQDFSQVTEASIQETAALFVACRQGLVDATLEFDFRHQGEAIRYPVHLPVAGTIRWDQQVSRGEVSTELQDSLDQPVPKGHLEPGWYVLLVYAQKAPATGLIRLRAEADEEVCYGRKLDEVMDTLGFPNFDREMARNLINAF